MTAAVAQLCLPVIATLGGITIVFWRGPVLRPSRSRTVAR